MANKDLENKCSDSYLYNGKVLCRAKWNCPEQSKRKILTGEQYGISNKITSGVSLPMCKARGQIDDETKAAYLETDATKDLDKGKYNSAIRKYRKASELSDLSYDKKSELIKEHSVKDLGNGNFKEFIMHLSLADINPEAILESIKISSLDNYNQNKNQSDWKLYRKADSWLEKIEGSK
ncbi:hypothetical protein GF374_02980 [Candidatus Woesearchaeota archaeon]|nr:hypothetical protein [Candidatus Woesearchaeota archaeon]